MPIFSSIALFLCPISAKHLRLAPDMPGFWGRLARRHIRHHRRPSIHHPTDAPVRRDIRPCNHYCYVVRRQSQRADVVKLKRGVNTWRLGSRSGSCGFPASSNLPCFAHSECAFCRETESAAGCCSTQPDPVKRGANCCQLTIGR